MVVVCTMCAWVQVHSLSTAKPEAWSVLLTISGSTMQRCCSSFSSRTAKKILSCLPESAKRTAGRQAGTVQDTARLCTSRQRLNTMETNIRFRQTLLFVRGRLMRCAFVDLTFHLCLLDHQKKRIAGYCLAQRLGCITTHIITTQWQTCSFSRKFR